MSSVTAKARYTPEDLLKRPDEKFYELVDGQLVERNMAYASALISARVMFLLGRYCDDHSEVGSVAAADAGFQCFPDDPNKVRKPDASFICQGRLPAEQMQEGYVRIAPDLAVEVISPNDLAYDIDRKVQEYLEAGVRLVWVVNPERRTITIHRAGGSVSKLASTDELSGENVVTGFRCALKEVFRPLDTFESTK